MKFTTLVATALLLGVAAAECPNGCSQHGKCNLYSACECYRNWMGADCSERVCYFGHAFVDTAQGDINSDGIVGSSTYTTQFTNDKTWELYDLSAHGKGAAAMGSWGFDQTAIVAAASGLGSFAPVMQVHDGSAKTSPGLWDEAHFYRECSNKGICNRQTGQCACFKGYEGEGCTRTACANDCSGHGVCERLKDADSLYEAWDAYKTQQCVCDAGYMGPDCSLRKCPQGDDPVSRVQNTEKQVFGFTPFGTSDARNEATDAITKFGGLYGIAESFFGRFALKFTDEFGDSWTTSTLNWPSGPFNVDGMCNGTAASNGGSAHQLTKGDKNQRHKTTLDDSAGADADFSFCSISTTAEIEAALKALPNNAIQDATVTFNFENSGASAAATKNSGWAYTVEFTGNSGNVQPLEVLYEVTQCIGTDSCNRALGTAYTYSSQGTTESPTLESAYVQTIAFAANGAAAAGVTLTQGAATGIVVNGGCIATACYVRSTSATAFSGTAVVAGVGAQASSPTWPFDGTSAQARVAVASVVSGTSLRTALMTSTDFPFLSTANAVVKVGATDINGVVGTTENAVCSNRGLCDYTTGLCKCFAGYTKGDCSTQNSQIGRASCRERV